MGSPDFVAPEDDAQAKPNTGHELKPNPREDTKRQNVASRQPSSRKRKADTKCSPRPRQSSPRKAAPTKETPKVSARALPLATDEPPSNATKRDRRRTPQIAGRVPARPRKERSTKTLCTQRASTDNPSKKRPPSVAGTSDEQVTRQKLSRVGSVEGTTKVLHTPSQIPQNTPQLIARLEGAGAAACKAAALMAQVAEQARQRADELCAAASAFEGQSPAAELAREAASAVTELSSVAKVAHAFSATAQRTFAVSVSFAVQDRRIFDAI